MIGQKAALDGRRMMYSRNWIVIRAVEPDFKKSNKNPDAKVGYRLLYPRF